MFFPDVTVVLLVGGATLLNGLLLLIALFGAERRKASLCVPIAGFFVAGGLAGAGLILRDAWLGVPNLSPTLCGISNLAMLAVAFRSCRWI